MGIANCTFDNNGAATGGGIAAEQRDTTSTSTILNCTFNQNTASKNGGGIWVGNNTTLNLGNTLLKKGTTGANLAKDTTNSTLTSLGNNLSDDAAGGDNTTAPGGYLNHSGDQRNTDPKLAAAGLADNGGPTQTIALQSTSPAINAGSNSLAVNPGANGQIGGGDDTTLTTDQRGPGHARKVGGTVDIGAYERSVESLVVTTTTDEDDGTSDAGTGSGTSLREAINYANSLTNNPTITFNLGAGTHTIQLGSQLPTLAANMTIQGPGADLLTVNGGGQTGGYGLLAINNGSAPGDSPTDTSPTVTLFGLTFSNGYATNNSGGAIYSQAKVLYIRYCTLSNNTAAQFGGAILNGGGNMAVASSTFANNTAPYGGGIADLSGALNVVNSTFANNTASLYGGGIVGAGDTLNVLNCTFNNNTASTNGGAIALTNSSTLSIANTLLKKGSHGANLYNDSSTITSLGNNLSDDAAGGNTMKSPGGYLSATGDQRNTDPKLAAAGLANNGGPTQTIALQPGSPAINAGNNDFAIDLTNPPGNNGQFKPLTYDQRGPGYPRIQDNTVDIGSYEVAPLPHSLIVTTTVDEDNNTSDPSVGAGTSLREAINYANTLSNSPTITFNLGAGSHTINLTSALPNLSKNMTIQGPGSTLLAVRRSTAQNTPAFRVFTIDNVTTTISGLTISNGRDTSGQGGGIFNVGTLTLTGCVLTGNRVNFTGGAFGGGLYTTGKTTLNTCVFSSNSVNSISSDNPDNGGTSQGGGIYGGAALTINNCTLSNNMTVSSAPTAGGSGGISQGGGLLYRGEALTLNNCTLSNNAAVGNGGTTSGNGGISQGGGLFANATTVTFNNCTLSGNTTSANAGSNGGTAGTGQGGVVFNNGGSLTLRNCTLSGNSSSQGSGVFSNAGTVKLGNTLLKSGAQGANLETNGGTITSAGHNLSDDDGGGFLSGNGDQINTAPKLDPAGLKNNGGPTQTIALQASSPAVDGGSNALIPPDSGDQDGDGNTSEASPFDQRGTGFPRIQAGTVDIGAFEAAGPTLAINDVSGDEGNSGNTAFTFTVTLSRSLPTATTVHYATANETANAGSDYTAKSGTLTIPANTLSGTITIQVTGDTARESDESFVVNLSNSNNASISDAQGIGTITNDDFEADLQLTQTAPAQTTTNSDVTFTLSVKNNGPDTATNVVVSDTLPVNATFESSNPAATSNTGGVLTFNLGTLTSTSSRSISITVQAPGTDTGTNSSVTNTASVSQSGSRDTDSSNNTSIKTVQVVASVQNVTAQTRIQRGDYSSTGSYSSGLFKPNGVVQTVKLTNTSGHDLQGPVSLVLDQLKGATLSNADGKTSSSQSPSGSPYVNVSVGKDGIWSAGETVSVQVKFNKKPNTYTPRVLAGPGAR